MMRLPADTAFDSQAVCPLPESVAGATRAAAEDRRRHGRFLACAAALAIAIPSPLLAQEQSGGVTGSAARPAEQDNGDAPAPRTEDEIGFAADSIAYDSEADVVTAQGNVELVREGNRLNAATVVWNRRTGQVVATGNVRATDPQGNIAYGDAVEITDSLKDGVVTNLLLVMEEGGRLAAQRGVRTGDIYTLDKAAYSPCSVEDNKGCPKTPSWQIKAVRVTYSPEKQKVSYKNARLELFGVPILYLPSFSHPVGGAGGTGFLVPDLGISGNNGFEISTPFYVKLARNRDLTLTPHFYTEAAPLLDGTYRHLTDNGAYYVQAMGTYGNRISADTGANTGERDVRAYIEAAGKFQLTPNWSISGSVRRVTDRTFLRRYNISRDDRLRSTFNAEHITTDSYLSVAGWSFQGLRRFDKAGEMPIVLPAIDYRLRLADPIADGRFDVQLNSLALARTDGQDTQRAFAGVKWHLDRLTGMGQLVTFTLYGRADVYHSSDNALTQTAIYRGDEGWETRGIAAAAADMRWPFSGPAFGGVQRITPRVQIVAAPKLSNLHVPNEDARSVDLEDSNLFALNRFPGYDRFEDSSRVTYGLEYDLTLPDFTLNSIVGQSYRLNSRPTLLPDGTGLSSRTSDVVGRTTVRYRELVSLTHRFRLDKDNLAVRVNEVDLTLGSRRTYVTARYLRLDRNVAPTLEDLSDREELRLGARIAFARYWSVFGSTVIDLTDRKDDPLTIADGFEPVRHRAGLAYQDECVDISLTWKRDYPDLGDARKSNTFQLRLAFRNLGI